MKRPRKDWGMSCDVGEATEGLANEALLIIQFFRHLFYLRHRHFTYVTWRTAHAVHTKLYHRSNLIVGGSWNKSLNLQPLQRCYCENSGSSASACVMRRHCSITYSQSIHAVNGLLLSSDIRTEGSIAIVKKLDFNVFYDF